MSGKRTINSNWVVWLIVGTGIGVGIGKFLSWPYFEFSKEINIVDFLNIFITIALTFYVARILNKRLKQEQFKSDLYTAKISEIENQLKQIENLLVDNKIEYQKINTIVHIIGLEKNALFASLTNCQIVNDEFLKIKENLKTKHKDFKVLLTDRPINKQDISVIVKNNIISYSIDRIAEIVTTINLIKEDYFELKVLLNK